MVIETGTFESTLDDKGRVSIPAQIREKYARGQLVITQGMQPSVYIMTPTAWELFSGKLMDSETLNEEEYNLIQYQYILPAQVGEIDKSGRVAIPPAIRKYAGLTRDCLVMNAENHLEIWDAEFFYAYLKENRARTQEAMRQMGALRLFKTDEKE
ncbi:protein MraZ [Treponema primitia ZAS-2]|uniref:Transcriptional regulator MraZ n=1 Tax=Treponema primitia (strain ATCC BAA-887 / DSM 12427 / ZAS-2) TaxID=545694 RepID=F5YGK2_TREPZ|nr:MraZ family transcriptional regulator [Treponema primitia]AEF83866.1 protein MraZ [Treponema primitia ZAS-2]